MKRIFLILAVLASVAAFSSCSRDKEGEFTPKKKIKAVYVEQSHNRSGTWRSDGRYLNESYNWDGKLLASINYYDCGDFLCTETFSYDKKNRITGSTFTGDIDPGFGTEYTYDGKELKKISFKFNDIIGEEVVFTHSDGKISEMTIIYYDLMLMRKKAMQRINPLRTILPSQTAEVIDHAMMEHAKNKKNSEALSIKLQFTWDGKNTKSISFNVIDGYDDVKAKLDYTYDKKRNPFNCLITALDMSMDLAMDNIIPSRFFSMLSKNNPLTLKGSFSEDGDEDEEFSGTYTYDYDGKWPTKSTLEVPTSYNDWEYNEETGEYEPHTINFIERVVTEYEYED